MSGTGFLSRARIDFGTAPRWGRVLVVLFLVAVVSVGMAINRTSGPTATLTSIDRVAARADEIAAKARAKAWALNTGFDQATSTDEQAKMQAEADAASLLFFQANETFGQAIVASLRTLKEPISAAARKELELKIRLFTAQSRAAAAAGSACAVAADEANADFAVMRALMEEHEARVVQEREEVDRLAAEVKRLTAEQARL